jgi:hypothetical protein
LGSEKISWISYKLQPDSSKGNSQISGLALFFWKQFSRGEHAIGRRHKAIVMPPHNRHIHARLQMAHREGEICLTFPKASASDLNKISGAIGAIGATRGAGARADDATVAVIAVVVAIPVAVFGAANAAEEVE